METDRQTSPNGDRLPLVVLRGCFAAKKKFILQSLLSVSQFDSNGPNFSRKTGKSPKCLATAIDLKYDLSFFYAKRKSLTAENAGKKTEIRGYDRRGEELNIHNKSLYCHEQTKMTKKRCLLNIYQTLCRKYTSKKVFICVVIRNLSDFRFRIYVLFYYVFYAWLICGYITK